MIACSDGPPPRYTPLNPHLRKKKLLPEIGSRLYINHGGRVRLGLILGYDSHEENAFIRWCEYHLPDETLPVYWL